MLGVKSTKNYDRATIYGDYDNLDYLYFLGGVL